MTEPVEPAEPAPSAADAGRSSLLQFMLYALSLPERTPTLREAARTIAPLDGFLGRKGDGEPGLQTLWRGLRSLEDLALGRRLARRYRIPPLKRAR